MIKKDQEYNEKEMKKRRKRDPESYKKYVEERKRIRD